MLEYHSTDTTIFEAIRIYKLPILTLLSDGVRYQNTEDCDKNWWNFTLPIGRMIAKLAFYKNVYCASTLSLTFQLALSKVFFRGLYFFILFTKMSKVKERI